MPTSTATSAATRSIRRSWTFWTRSGWLRPCFETVSHTQVRGIVPPLPGPKPLAVDFANLGGRFPFMTVMRQVEFLQSVAAQAGPYPDFKLVMGANVREVVGSDGIVRG